MDAATEEAMGGAEAAQGAGWGDLGEATVVDGVRLIAGGIESVLQRLQIQVICAPSDCYRNFATSTGFKPLWWLRSMCRAVSSARLPEQPLKA